MNSKPPFQVGQRVRMRLAYRKRSQRKSFEGVVTRLERFDELTHGWRVSVRLDGLSPKTGPARIYVCDGESCEWEVVPLEDWTADTVARSLAKAVLEDGDMNAAMLLADRIMELCGATTTRGSQ